MEAHTFQRISSYFLDLIIVTLLLSLFTFWIPSSSKYDDALEKQAQLTDKFLEENDANYDSFINDYYKLEYTKNKETILESCIGVALFLTYFVGFAYIKDGQTIGKKVMKIKIVDKDGKSVSQLKLFARAFMANELLLSIYTIITMFFINSSQYLTFVGYANYVQVFFIFVSLMLIVYRKDKRSIHDLICGTKVVQV